MASIASTSHRNVAIIEDIDKDTKAASRSSCLPCQNNDHHQQQQQQQQLPDNICFCTERKRHTCRGKVHLIEGDAGPTRDDGPVKKRARVEESNNCGTIRGCCDGDLVESIRKAMLDLLQERLNNSTLPPLSRNADNDESSKQQLLETVEMLLFSTAFTLEEYASLETLDERLARLLVALLNRHLRIGGA